MDVIFPSYSRSFRRFELGQLPATGADAAFAELDSEVAKLEEERRRQAEADAAAAAAAANQMGPPAPAPAPAAGTGLNLSVRQPTVGDQFNFAAGTRTRPFVERAGAALRADTAAPSGEFVGPPAPDQSSLDTQKPKSNMMLYVGIAAGVLAIGGAAFYFLRKKG